jgi:nitrite reductase (NADH) large subunit
MSAVLKTANISQHAGTQLPIVVVGTGPVGIRLVEDLMLKDPGLSIIIYGNEPWEPYNRVRLTGLLTGEMNLGNISNGLKLEVGHQITQYHNCRIVSVDQKRQQVIDCLGRRQSYYKLVFATGSSPHIPNIPGLDKLGTYTYRNLNDIQELLARRTRSRHTVILGGGLLGLEAAIGLQKLGTKVTVIDHADHLMSQQLDEQAGALLREHIMARHINVLLGKPVKEVLGDEAVTGIRLGSGQVIECDTIVISTGIRPNIDLALAAGIAVGKGIKVNDSMQTSDAHIYAVGECCEHRDKVYGLVAPGLEQARVAAHQIIGGKSSYKGAQSSSRLKVAGVYVYSIGNFNEFENTLHYSTLTWKSSDNQSYRKLFFNRNRLTGAIAFGEWPESNRIQEAINRHKLIWPWQRMQFVQKGILWSAESNSSVIDWPSTAVVCQCMQVNRGVLTHAIEGGCKTQEELVTATGASTVCGSCSGLLADMLGDKSIPPDKASGRLVIFSTLALLSLIAIVLLPSFSYQQSVQASIQWDLLWRDSLFKQISGFTLLGLSVLVSLISLRKRLTKFNLGQYFSWRWLHILTGVMIVATLIAHTGMRLGYNLNGYLMLCMIALLFAGSIGGAVIGLQHKLPRRYVGPLKELSLWSHILLLWPLPVLLGFHVFKSYWF